MFAWCLARRSETGLGKAWASPKNGLARLLPTGYGNLDSDPQDHHYPRPEGAMLYHRNLLRNAGPGHSRPAFGTFRP